MTLSERFRRLTAVQEALFVWGVSFAAIVVTYLAAQGYAKLTATVMFLYLPGLFMRERNEDYATYGVTLRRWKEDLRWFGWVVAVIVPTFFLAFWLWSAVLPHLPARWAHLLSPYVGTPHFQPRLPNRFGEWVIDNLFVVALPEEFFYRGYLQTRLRDAWPRGRVLWGARLGPAFWLTAVLFAVGHLAIFEVWRLAVFFPALLFGWMREKTGTVMGAALFHAFANLYMLWLEASFFGLS
jgi:uncharacterized protein